MQKSIKRGLAALIIGSTVLVGTTGCEEASSFLSSIELEDSIDTSYEKEIASSSSVAEALKTPVTEKARKNVTQAIPKLATLDVIEKEGKMTGYNRNDYDHWISVSKLMKTEGSSDDWKRLAKGLPSSCSAREAILIHQSITEPVVGDNCKVESGSWIDGYGKWENEQVVGLGKVMTDPRAEIQIDHLIALGGAHRLGSGEWSAEKKARFANDPLNLISSDGPANGSKGDRLVDAWVPYNPNDACEYMADTVNISKKYNLPVTKNIKESLEIDFGRCLDEVSPQFMF